MTWSKFLSICKDAYPQYILTKFSVIQLEIAKLGMGGGEGAAFLGRQNAQSK